MHSATQHATGEYCLLSEPIISQDTKNTARSRTEKKIWPKYRVLTLVEITTCIHVISTHSERKDRFPENYFKNSRKLSWKRGDEISHWNCVHPTENIFHNWDGLNICKPVGKRSIELKNCSLRSTTSSVLRTISDTDTVKDLLTSNLAFSFS